MGPSGHGSNGTLAKNPLLQKVWLLEERHSDESSALGALLRKLAEKPLEEIVLLGSSQTQCGILPQVRESPCDVLVMHEASWPKGAGLEELCELEVGFLVVASPANYARFRSLADRSTMTFVSPNSGMEALQLGLRNLAFQAKRDGAWRTLVNSLRQRLNDRIVIEKAKGILVQTLGINEEEAYKRLRLSSRRQRRQIKDIAQSLIDTQSLLTFGDMPLGRQDSLASMPKAHSGEDLSNS